MKEPKPDQLKRWVDGPFPLISPSRSGAAVGKELPPARAMAAEMSLVHNGLIRGINSIYNQSANVAERGSNKDHVDFANYAFQVVEVIHEHHDFEEETLFPKMNDLAGVPGLMDSNVNEHAAFQDGMNKFAGYLKEVKEGKQEFNGETAKGLIDSFMPTLHTHLVNEIDSLVALEKYDDKVNWFQFFTKEAEKLNKSFVLKYDFRVKVLPLFMALHDKSFEGGVWQNFPPIPMLVQWLLRWLYMNRKMDWWRFAGCDLTSRPQDLPFA